MLVQTNYDINQRNILKQNKSLLAEKRHCFTVMEIKF